MRNGKGRGDKEHEYVDAQEEELGSENDSGKKRKKRRKNKARKHRKALKSKYR